MTAVFKANRVGIGEMLRSDGVAAEVIRRAALIKAAAEASAPYDPAEVDHYRDHFTLEGSTHGGVKGDRAEGLVVNDDPAAIYIEYGTGDTPRHRTLGTAIDAARD